MDTLAPPLEDMTHVGVNDDSAQLYKPRVTPCEISDDQHIDLFSSPLSSAHSSVCDDHGSFSRMLKDLPRARARIKAWRSADPRVKSGKKRKVFHHMTLGQSSRSSTRPSIVPTKYFDLQWTGVQPARSSTTTDAGSLPVRAHMSRERAARDAEPKQHGSDDAHNGSEPIVTSMTPLSIRKDSAAITDRVIEPRPSSIDKSGLQEPLVDTADQAALLEMSNRIMHKTSMSEKSSPRGMPRVWADSRQALCETILYYQAWQGACYINKGVLYAFMFDSNGHCRDLIDEDVVIARAGGGMIKDKDSSEMIQSRDQKENFQTQAVRNAIALQNPIVIFAGSENADIATQMPHRYCSLAWFKATHVWSEKTITKTGQAYEQIKYRFEKLDCSQPSWWAAVTYEQPVRVGDLDRPLEHDCCSCQKSSSKVYLEGWMCLNAECPRFWILPDGLLHKDDELHYDPRFLKQKTLWKNESAPYDMRPALPEPARRMGEDVTFAMTRGMCCPHCGMCSSRVLWRGWHCSNCGFEHCPQHVIITADAIRDPYFPVSYACTQSADWTDRSRVSTTVEFSHNYRITHFRVDGIDGLITHLSANRTVHEEPQGPNDMYEAMQSVDVGLARRRFTTGREEYMTAFSCNAGMPYKFVASVDSQSFESSAWPLSVARTRMNWAARLVLKDALEEGHDFNELLTIGYFTGQNIKYHDDGETGLGKTVATLSLGHPADMFFRLKAKHFTGVSKSGYMTEADPIPGSLQFAARKQMLDALRAMGPVDHVTKTRWLHDAAKRLGLTQSAAERKPWLRLRLSHGDIVIMHGYKVQEYLEVSLVAMSGTRLTSTASSRLAWSIEICIDLPDHSA